MEITQEQLEELEKWESEKYCKAAVSQDGDALQYVTEQSEEICKAAVSQNGYALRYVKEQSEAVCIEAVKQTGDAWRYFSKKIYSKFKVKKTVKKKVCCECGREL